jgi:hypothetical protein
MRTSKAAVDIALHPLLRVPRHRNYAVPMVDHADHLAMSPVRLRMGRHRYASSPTSDRTIARFQPLTPDLAHRPIPRWSAIRVRAITAHAVEPYRHSTVASRAGWREGTIAIRFRGM